MALAIDGSTPGVGTATSGAATTRTITNCPANAGIVACTTDNTTSGDTNVTMAITDDHSDTYTQTAVRYEGDSGGSAGFASLNWARNGGSTATIVVTATGGGTGIRGEISLKVWVLTSVKASGSFIGAVTEQSSVDANAMNPSLTTTGDGSMVFLVNSDWWAETSYTFGGTVTNDGSAINNLNNGYAYAYLTNPITSSGSSAQIASTNASHTARNNTLLFEVLAEPASGFVRPTIIVPTGAVMRASGW